jgi:hypothetical protein
MTKQYVFWRNSKGKPCTNEHENEKHAPKQLLKQYGEECSRGENGGLSWQQFPNKQLDVAIASTLIVLKPDGRELNEDDAREIAIHGGMESLRNRPSVTAVAPKDFLRYCNEEAAKRFRSESKPYIMLASLSIRDFPASVIRVGEHDISPVTNASAMFPQPGCIPANSVYVRMRDDCERAGYERLQVTTSGISRNDAVAKATDAINLTRALWTLYATAGRWTIRFGVGAQHPIGEIRLGPIQTLHHPDGNVVDDCFWGDHDPAPIGSLFTPGDKWSKLEKTRLEAMEYISQTPYRQELESLLCRYAVALNHSHLDVAALHLWSLLERITNTVGAHYDTTIKRATWIYENQRYGEEFLEAVRCRRNQFVHAAKSGVDRDQEAVPLKGIT